MSNAFTPPYPNEEGPHKKKRAKKIPKCIFGTICARVKGLRLRVANDLTGPSMRAGIAGWGVCINLHRWRDLVPGLMPPYAAPWFRLGQGC